ncbi:MAG: hypothetical protein R2772_07575 [Chitinophagales bacterium]
MSPIFCKLKDGGPNFVSKQQLVDTLHYCSIPSEELYLIYDIDTNLEEEFANYQFDLAEIIPNEWDKKPFTLSLKDFMKSAFE